MCEILWGSLNAGNRYSRPIVENWDIMQKLFYIIFTVKKDNLS